MIDGRCEISNNRAERKAKSYAVGRKAFLFHTSEAGAGASAVMYSIVETAKEKYKIIEEMISRDNNLLNISKLCKVADVSRSGFYSWRKNKDKREAKEEKDRNDFELILEEYLII